MTENMFDDDVIQDSVMDDDIIQDSKGLLDWMYDNDAHIGCLIDDVEQKYGFDYELAGVNAYVRKLSPDELRDKKQEHLDDGYSEEEIEEMMSWKKDKGDGDLSNFLSDSNLPLTDQDRLDIQKGIDLCNDSIDDGVSKDLKKFTKVFLEGIINE